MKIIDKTPLVDEKGNLGFQQRIQGMLQFGFNWPRELEVQKAIVTFFDRQLEKGYTLIRNMPLGASGIVIPIILLGPAGIFVITIANLKGRYEAKGDSWNIESGNGYKPAPVNLVQNTKRMARALTVFIERQGARIPVEIEPVLIAGDPGLHIESNKPGVRVMMIDGIKSFVSGLASSRPVMGSESVFDLTERILNPRPPKKESAESAIPTAPPMPRSSWEQQPPQQEPSRAKAIFDASQQVKPFDPSDFDFAMNDEEALPDIPPVSSSVSTERSAAKPSSSKSKLIFGMKPWQVAVIFGLFLCLVAILAGGAAYYYFYILS